MFVARRNCGVGVLNGQLYAVGGRNESKQVRTTTRSKLVLWFTSVDVESKGW